jgi:hypothetical protein
LVGLTGNGPESGQKMEIKLGNCRESSDTLDLNNIELEATQ